MTASSQEPALEQDVTPEGKAGAKLEGKQERGKPRSSLGDRIYHLLYSRIVNGDYPTNQKLPPELMLAEEFGVSRPVLRSALERLRDEGLLYSRQGAGSYVRRPQQAALGFARVETIADIQRCYEFRITIETDAAYHAALRHNPEALREIKAALDLLDAATGSLKHREDADYAFHMAVVRASNNHFYETSLRALREHIQVGMKMHGQSLMSDGPRGLEQAYLEHKGIYEAIVARDAAGAKAAMMQHINNSRDRLFGGGMINLSLGA